MDIKNMAVQMLMSKIGSESDTGAAESALSELVGGSGGFGVDKVLAQFMGAGGDLGNKAKSWLGDGANESITTDQLQEAIGADKIDAFASKLGVTREQASGSLSELLPQLIDKSSSGGVLLDSVGGAGDLAGLASKFLK